MLPNLPQVSPDADAPPAPIVQPIISYDEPSQPRRLFANVQANLADPDTVASQLAVLEDPPPKPRSLLGRAKTNVETIDLPPHGPWLPWDEESKTPVSRPGIWRRRHNDPDLVGQLPALYRPHDEPAQFSSNLLDRAQSAPDETGAPSLQWITSNYDEPPGPRREIIRSRATDPDIVSAFIHASWQPWDEESKTPQARPGIWRRRHNDPDLVATFIHIPWQAFVFDDQDSPKRQRVTPRSRQADPDPDTFPTIPIAVIVTEDQAPSPRREIFRARTVDPDLIGALAPIWRPFIFDDQNNPKSHPRLYRARQIDPDIFTAITLPTITFVFDEPPGPRRVLLRARTNDPDLVTAFIHAPWLPFVFDEPLRPRLELLRSRAFNFEPSSPPTALRPVIFSEDSGPFARRLVWHRPLAVHDLIQPLAARPFIFNDQDAPRALRLLLRSRRDDPDVIVRPITIIPSSTIFIEDGQSTRPRLMRLLWRLPFNEPDFILPPFPIVPPVIPYVLLEMTAPQFILDLAGIMLPIGVEIARIVSVTPLSGLFAAYPVLQSFADIAIISAGRTTSPRTGLLQAISGEVQAMRNPAIVRFQCIDSNGNPFIVDGIYKGVRKFFY
jgi:hypothetical protein